MKEEKKKLYLLDSKIQWSIFKKLNDKIVKDDGPTPINIEKVLWTMLRRKMIYCWFCEDWPNDIGLGIKIPNGYEIEIIKNPRGL